MSLWSKEMKGSVGIKSNFISTAPNHNLHIISLDKLYRCDTLFPKTLKPDEEKFKNLGGKNEKPQEEQIKNWKQ